MTYKDKARKAKWQREYMRAYRKTLPCLRKTLSVRPDADSVKTQSTKPDAKIPETQSHSPLLANYHPP